MPEIVDDAFRRLTADRRFNAGVMAIFGAIAILIGAIGIYGTMAFLVAQRVREIGVRVALGATPSRVMRTVIRDASWCVLLGLVVGLASARAVSSLFTSLVFGVTPTSPSIYIGVAALLVIVGKQIRHAPTFLLSLSAKRRLRRYPPMNVRIIWPCRCRVICQPRACPEAMRWNACSTVRPSGIVSEYITDLPLFRRSMISRIEARGLI